MSVNLTKTQFLKVLKAAFEAYVLRIPSFVRWWVGAYAARRGAQA
jgi:hypothetical protein